MVINQQDFNLHDKLIDRIDIHKFVISHKLLFNGYFETPLSIIHENYWEYAKIHNMVGQSLSKNIESFFNLHLFRNFSAISYNIKDIDLNELHKALTIAFDNYKSRNKYSSLKGFKENDINYKLLLSQVKYLKENARFKQIDDINGLNIFIVSRPKWLDSNAFYSSKLNLIEISEYANFIYNEIVNFDPDKNTDKETIKQPDKESIKHPFNDDDNTLELFNYIVDNWRDYKPDIKWAYIYNFIDDPKIYPTDYERYVRETQNFKGHFNYNNANSQKVYDALHELKKAFIENYR